MCFRNILKIHSRHVLTQLTIIWFLFFTSSTLNLTKKIKVTPPLSSTLRNPEVANILHFKSVTVSLRRGVSYFSEKSRLSVLKFPHCTITSRLQNSCVVEHKELHPPSERSVWKQPPGVKLCRHDEEQLLKHTFDWRGTVHQKECAQCSVVTFLIKWYDLEAIVLAPLWILPQHILVRVTTALAPPQLVHPVALDAVWRRCAGSWSGSERRTGDVDLVWVNLGRCGCR